MGWGSFNPISGGGRLIDAGSSLIGGGGGSSGISPINSIGLPISGVIRRPIDTVRPVIPRPPVSLPPVPKPPVSFPPVSVYIPPVSTPLPPLPPFVKPPSKPTPTPVKPPVKPPTNVIQPIDEGEVGNGNGEEIQGEPLDEEATESMIDGIPDSVLIVGGLGLMMALVM